LRPQSEVTTQDHSPTPPTRVSGALAVWGGSVGYMSRVHMQQTGCVASCLTCRHGKVAVVDPDAVCVRLSRAQTWTYRRSPAPPTRFSGALAVWGGSVGYMSRVHMQNTEGVALCSTCSHGKVAVESPVCVRLSLANLDVSEVSWPPHSVFWCSRGMGRVCRVHEPSPHAKHRGCGLVLDL
jgi:hypothetical protein